MAPLKITNFSYDIYHVVSFSYKVMADLWEEESYRSLNLLNESLKNALVKGLHWEYGMLRDQMHVLNKKENSKTTGTLFKLEVPKICVWITAPKYPQEHTYNCGTNLRCRGWESH